MHIKYKWKLLRKNKEKKNHFHVLFNFSIILFRNKVSISATYLALSHQKIVCIVKYSFSIFKEEESGEKSKVSQRRCQLHDVSDSLKINRA